MAAPSLVAMDMAKKHYCFTQVYSTKQSGEPKFRFSMEPTSPGCAGRKPCRRQLKSDPLSANAKSDPSLGVDLTFFGCASCGDAAEVAALDPVAVAFPRDTNGT